MRPQLFTPRNIILFLLAALIFGGTVVWLQGGSKIAFLDAVPSTAGKIVWARSGDLYMADSATGDNTVLLTTDKNGADGEPAWSSDGETVALTSDRNGITRQLYMMSATPGAKVSVRTNSSSTKEAPQWGAGGDIYFLDGGRIAKLSPKTGDIDAVFPSADLKRAVLSEQSDTAAPTHFAVSPDGTREFGSISLFGGITQFLVSPDGTRFFAVIKQERGEVFVMYSSDGVLATFGVAQSVLIKQGASGGVVAVFCGGEPLQRPALLLKKSDLAGLLQPGAETELEHNLTLNKTDQNTMIRVDDTFAIQPVSKIPFAPSGIAVSLDGNRVAVTSTDPKFRGVFAVSLDGGQAKGGIAALPASEPVWSPDGTQIAFVSGKNVFTASSVPGAAVVAPVNLTKDVGTNTAPAWSPAKPK